MPEDTVMEETIGYPVCDIEAVRESLTAYWLQRPSRNDFEMNLKRKCGVFTPEVIAYFESGKRVKPNKFDAEYVFKSSVPDTVNEYDEIILDIDSNDSMSENTAATEAEIQSEIDFLENQFDRVSGGIEKKSHACFLDRYCHMCPYTMKSQTTASTSEIVYVCNFCRVCYSNANRMRQHLEDRYHFSAGEYVSKRTKAPVVNYCKCEIGSSVREILATQKRVAMTLQDKREEKSSKGVFCPKCDAFFSVDVLACAVHYRFVHGAPDHGYMYSVGELQEVRDIALTARHVCLTCNLQFKRLKDLVSHLEITRHAPFAPRDQIYVYRCSCCSFNTTYFMQFKLHVVEHRSTNNGAASDDQEMYGEVYAYAKPAEFYHLSAPSCQSEYKEELEIVEKLLRSNNNKQTMGVTDLLIKPLLDRKNELTSLV